MNDPNRGRANGIPAPHPGTGRGEPAPGDSRSVRTRPIPDGSRLGLPIAAVAAAMAWSLATFHLAYLPSRGWLIALFPFGVVPLIRLPTGRQAFYVGLVLGIGLYAPQLGFFWTIFGPPAVLLWGILAFWPATFLLLAQALLPALGSRWMMVVVPLLWTGTEYFRSEVYYLRFSWLSPGYALAGSTPMTILPWIGVYGAGLVLFLGAAIFWHAGGWQRWLGPAIACAVAGLNHLSPATPTSEAGRPLTVAGAQIESVDPSGLPEALDQLSLAYPAAELLVLPEYSLADQPSPELLEWCRSHRRHLIIGGTERVAEGGFRNTAWVIDADGRVAFKQAKSVPIQFFADGLPAPSQTVWESPWGRLGIAVCYDLSYVRVMDHLVRQGAEALVIPTMDAHSWGQRQHTLHARIAPARAAEYGIPIVRCASSGVSQIVDRRGRVLAEAPMDAGVRLFGGTILLDSPGRRPFDRWLAPFATAATAGGVLFLGGGILWKRRLLPRHPVPPAPDLPSS